MIQYVNQLVARYQKKYPDSFNLHRFDLEENNPAEIENAIKGVSFFSEVKFMVIKNPFVKSDFLEKIIKENNPGKQKNSVLLLYQTGEPEKFKSSNLFALLTKTAQTKEFKSLTSQAANKFAVNYLTKSNISTKKEIIAKLVKQTSPDLWHLKNEMDKLISLAKGEGRKEITDEDLIKLVNFKVDQNIFSIIEAAFSNQGRAIAIFEDYFNQGGDPLYLLSMIAFQLKNMLIVRELMEGNHQYGSILKKTGMHPFFFRKNYEAAKRYSLNELKAIFQKAADFEMALKTGQTEPENIFFKIFL